MTGISSDELLKMLKGASPAVRADVRRQLGRDTAPKPTRHKYSARAVTVDGVRYPSKREAEYHAMLRQMHAAGQTPWWCEQGRFLLPGPTHYLADFVVLREPLCDACQEKLVVVDTKGVKTAVYRLKRRQMRDVYGV